MKKFRFSLDTVLDYKRQMLDSAKTEYGTAEADVNRQENIVHAVEQNYADYNNSYRTRQTAGMTVAEAMLAQNALRALEKEIRIELDRLYKLRRRAEEKRQIMVEAKKDTSTIEKLREKKLDTYNKELQKSEERLIDEFISATRAISASGL